MFFEISVSLQPHVFTSSSFRGGTTSDTFWPLRLADFQTAGSVNSLTTVRRIATSSAGSRISATFERYSVPEWATVLPFVMEGQTSCMVLFSPCPLHFSHYLIFWADRRTTKLQLLLLVQNQPEGFLDAVQLCQLPQSFASAMFTTSTLPDGSSPSASAISTAPASISSSFTHLVLSNLRFLHHLGCGVSLGGFAFF